MNIKQKAAAGFEDRNTSDLSVVQRDNCTICLEPVSERAITSPCNHALFDYLCLLTWLLGHHARCPLCNTVVDSVSYDFISVNDFKTFKLPKQSAVANDTSCDSDGSRVAGQHRRHRYRRRRSPSPTADGALATRRQIYIRQLYSLYVGANRVSGYRNFTPREFAASPNMQARARKWVRRELRVFGFLYHSDPKLAARSTQNPEFLLEYIIALLRNVDVKDNTGKAQSIMQEYLGKANASLFLHELENWLRSPYVDIFDWDKAVQYSESP